MSGYTDTLKGKDVVICPDNDEAGKKHAAMLVASLKEHVRSLRMVNMPDGMKDVTDLYDSFEDDAEFVEEMERRIDGAQRFSCGPDLPIYTVEELEERYRQHIIDSEKSQVDLSLWLPALKGLVRPICGGDVMVLMARTGHGKSATAQSICAAIPVDTLYFDIELPDSLMFERWMSVGHGIPQAEVEHDYRHGLRIKPCLPHVYTCPVSRLSASTMRDLTVKSELKIGRMPKLVVVDYIQLVREKGRGGRYDQISDAMEEIKIAAKELNVPFLVLSQIGRKKDEDDSSEVNLFDGKGSGSIENSASLVIGAWRPNRDGINYKVLKQTRGSSGHTILCSFDGPTLTVSGGTLVTDEDE
jgi:replicative DNA helicase